MTIRRNTKAIYVGKVKIGQGAPITVQSMTKTDTSDIEATVKQISSLAEKGCEIIRVAVPDDSAANALKEICKRSPIPVIADIHFDHRLAIKSINNGVEGLRINPGNIGSEQKVKEVAKAALDMGIPIRVGVNAGSLESSIHNKHGKITSSALAESALKEVERLEKNGFDMIKVAVKAFELNTMTEAVKIVAANCPYPLHLGVTESGLSKYGIIRSSIGIGYLLMQGLGDTIRVSLTADPIEEVEVGKQILASLNLRNDNPTIVSCPTCGRCKIPLQKTATEVEERIKNLKMPIKVAIMGCSVNGPGEAKEADFGIAGGKNQGVLFSKGKVVATLPVEKLVEALIKEILNHTNKSKQ